MAQRSSKRESSEEPQHLLGQGPLLRISAAQDEIYLDHHERRAPGVEPYKRAIEGLDHPWGRVTWATGPPLESAKSEIFLVLAAISGEMS